jgi:hypothetical protein
MAKDMNLYKDMSVSRAQEILSELAERWHNTPVWHAILENDKPFHDGRIHITTEDLHAIAVLIDYMNTAD